MKILFILVAAIATMALATDETNPAPEGNVEGEVEGNGKVDEASGPENTVATAGTGVGGPENTVATAATAVVGTDNTVATTGAGVGGGDNAVTTTTTGSSVGGTDKPVTNPTNEATVGTDMAVETYIVEATQNAVNTFALAVVADRAQNYRDALNLYLQGMGYLWSSEIAISQSSRTKEEAEKLKAFLAAKCVQYKIRADKIRTYLKELKPTTAPDKAEGGGDDQEVDGNRSSSSSTGEPGQKPKLKPLLPILAAIWNKIVSLFRKLNN